MPAYNAGNFLSESIRSIQNQSYSNWELIIIDDASTDNSRKILRSFVKNDERIRLYFNQTNLGVSKTANIGISKANGKFIARMDADDIASFDRIEKQVEFLTTNKKTVAVGGQCELININGKKIGEKKFPLKNKEVKDMIFRSVPLQQPTLMVNKQLLPNKFVWYDEDYSSAEELEFIFRIFKFGNVQNIPNIVLKYRIHEGNTSLINPKKTFFLTLVTRINAIGKYSYRPSLMGIFVTLIQVMIVSILPNSWIYPIYSYIRGIKKFDINDIDWSGEVLFKKEKRPVIKIA